MCLSVQLPSQGSEIISFSPVLTLGKILFSPIGLQQMLNGTAAVQDCKAEFKDPGYFTLDLNKDNLNGGGDEGQLLEVMTMSQKMKCAVFTVFLRGCGIFLCYSNVKPLDLKMDGNRLEFEYNSEMCELAFEIPYQEDRNLNRVVEVLYKE